MPAKDLAFRVSAAVATLAKDLFHFVFRSKSNINLNTNRKVLRPRRFAPWLRMTSCVVFRV